MTMESKACHPLPESVLGVLKKGATIRTQRSLDLIYGICKELHQSGKSDFSVATVGRLSSQRGGPSVQAIRNKNGERYRNLVKAWTSQAGRSRRGLSAS
jgi:hypothetical protein